MSKTEVGIAYDTKRDKKFDIWSRLRAHAVVLDAMTPNTGSGAVLLNIAEAVADLCRAAADGNGCRYGESPPGTGTGTGGGGGITVMDKR